MSNKREAGFSTERYLSLQDDLLHEDDVIDDVKGADELVGRSALDLGWRSEYADQSQGLLDSVAYHLLVIDDEPDEHEMYQTTLGAVGRGENGESNPAYLVDSAYSGEEGVQAILRAEMMGTPYAVVFLDLRMSSGWSGLDTAEKIQAIDPAIRIILLIANIDFEPMEVRNRIARNFDFLYKPIDPDELAQLTALFVLQWERAYRFTKLNQSSVSQTAIPWKTRLIEEDQLYGSVLHVMLVEPSPSVRNFYEALLHSKTDYEVMSAANIGDALELVEQFSPDLTVVSFSLSGEGAEQLAQQVLNQQGKSESLFVYFADRDSVDELGFIAGAIEVLFKDDPTEVFLQRIRAMERYITNQKQLRASILLEAQNYDIAAEDAHLASREKEKLIASISHELRTPLTVILGNSDALLKSDLSENQRQLLHSVEVSARGQLAAINDIIDLSDIEAGQFGIDEAPYDLNALLNEIHDIFAAHARSAGLAFKVTLKQKPIHQLIGDGRRVGQILINLLNNALKFTQQGEITLTVWIDDALHFSVWDTGVGISSEEQEHLFHRHEQVDESISARYGGGGLGLTISLELAELMGGTIEVESEKGRGSCFQLNLPYRESEIESIDSTRNQRGAMLYTSFSGRVLVADDAPEIQMLVIRMLESMGIETLKASNGQEAVEAALKYHPDLILMDMQMPVMDGVEATQVLRELHYERPVVALTANVMKKHREQFAEAGCDDFLSKPIDRKALQQVLKSYLKEEAALSLQEIRPKTPSEGSLIDEKMMAMFIKRTQALINELREALDREDMVAIQGSAHKVKGSGTTFGFPELTQLAGRVCNVIELGRIDAVPQLVERLIEKMEQVVRSSIPSHP